MTPCSLVCGFRRFRSPAASVISLQDLDSRLAGSLEMLVRPTSKISDLMNNRLLPQNNMLNASYGLSNLEVYCFFSS
jgi:hypothetical protein